MDNKTAAVTMRNITKRFGPTLANDRVWLDIYRGEILALLGENGSGKTTLMNMLSGIYFPDEGEIAIDGRPVVIRSPKDAFELGIGMIHQHFKLVDVLTAAENIVLGLERSNCRSRESRLQRIRHAKRRLRYDADALCRRLWNDADAALRWIPRLWNDAANRYRRFHWLRNDAKCR